MQQNKNNLLDEDSSQRFLKLNVHQSAKLINPQPFPKQQPLQSSKSYCYRPTISPKIIKQRATTDPYDVGSFLSSVRNSTRDEGRHSFQPERRYTEGRLPQNHKSNQYFNSKQQPEDKTNTKTKNGFKTLQNPFISNTKAQQQKNRDYFKLHDKLSSIENKIQQMKRLVTHKREDKEITLHSKGRLQTEANQQPKPKSQQSDDISRKIQRQKGNLKQLVTQEPLRNQLHYATKNPYSPKNNIYYISEIVKTYKEDKSLARQHLLLSLQIFKLLANTSYASDDKIKQKKVKLPRKQGYQGKKTLIFDLDQTLIHCNDSLSIQHQVKLPIPFPNGQTIEAGINIRPYALDILKNLSSIFEIVVFTASHSCYANVVLDHLDPNHEFIQHRLYRQHCYQTAEGMYCKDLRIIDRELKDMILVDNAAYSYAPQPDNGIPILPYYHGTTDYELKALQNYLRGMTMIEDVRELNRKTFKLHRYHNYYNDVDKLVSELYIQQQPKN